MLCSLQHKPNLLLLSFTRERKCQEWLKVKKNCRFINVSRYYPKLIYDREHLCIHYDGKDLVIAIRNFFLVLCDGFHILFNGMWYGKQYVHSFFMYIFSPPKKIIMNRSNRFYAKYNELNLCGHIFDINFLLYIPKWSGWTVLYLAKKGNMKEILYAKENAFIQKEGRWWDKEHTIFLGKQWGGVWPENNVGTEPSGRNYRENYRLTPSIVISAFVFSPFHLHRTPTVPISIKGKTDNERLWIFLYISYYIYTEP